MDTATGNGGGGSAGISVFELGAKELPPVDKGWAAWLFVLNGFLLEMIIWGYSFTFGIIQVSAAPNVHLGIHSDPGPRLGTLLAGLPLHPPALLLQLHRLHLRDRHDLHILTVHPPRVPPPRLPPLPRPGETTPLGCYVRFVL